MIWNFFDRAYVINRDADTVRMTRMTARLKAQGIPFERMPALKPPSGIGQTVLPRGYVGCAMSHMACVERARADGLGNVLIFEDDAVLRDDAGSIMAHVVAELRGKQWDLLYLGWSTVGATKLVSDHLGQHDLAYHCHAYAVNHTGFDAVARACQDTIRHRCRTQDVELALRIDVNALHVNPLLAIQEPGYGVCVRRAVNYTGIYARCADMKDFADHCKEFRGFAAQ